MNREIIQQITCKLQELCYESIRKGKEDGYIGDLNLYFAKGLNEIGLKLLKEVYESIDEAIYKDNKKRHKFKVIKKDKKALLTSLGEVKFKKRLYKDSKGRSTYLFDNHLKISKGTRITVDAVSRVIDETIETSYRKGGINASISDSITKQTVKNILKTTEVPKVSYSIPKKKRKIEYLYIDADEDHIALQREYEFNAINKLIDGYDKFISKLYQTSINEISKKSIIDSDIYFRNNFDSICLRFSKDKHIVRCSAEGHISHILASRMSSRPVGWTMKEQIK